MKHQLTLPAQSNFHPEKQEDILNIENGLDIQIPGCFIYENNEGKKIDLYLHENNNYYTIRGELFNIGNNNSLKPKIERITKIDLLNFNGLDDIGIENLINTSLNININTEEGIEKLNSFFIEGINFLSDLGRSLPDKYTNDTFFTTKEEIIMFCKDTTKSGKKQAYINCLISKSISIVSDIINNEARMHLKERAQFIINKYIGNRSEFNMITNHKGYLTLGKKRILFSFTYRNKSDKSAQYKVAKDPKYSSSTKIYDDIGLTFYTKNKEDSILLHNYMNNIIFGEEGNYEIDNKSYYDESLIDIYEDKLSFTFLIKLKNNLGNVNRGTSNNYSEAKTKSQIDVPKREHFGIEGAIGDLLGFEMKFDIVGSENEKGLSFHPVYGHYKLYDIMCRFYHGFISDIEINFVIDLFFKNITKEITNKNKLLLEGEDKNIYTYFTELEYDLEKKGFLFKSNKGRKAKEEELKIGLKKYFLSKLLKVEIKGRKKYYYTNTREYNLSLAGYRKKMTIL